MLESFNAKHEMKYQRLSSDEKQRRGILGRLVGVIADFVHATRNGRHYTEELWDKTFNNPIVKEKIENRCLFGELGHPTDRQEIDMEKICICLAEMPKKGDDGKLYGVFDILDTPNGRILKTMCDYGCNIGVSSRGGGDTFEDYNGNETVDSDTYELECWDAVLLPAVKSARPKYVTESLSSLKTLKTALMEELDRSSEDDKRVMKNTLDELQIDYSAEEEISESADNIEVTEEEIAAKDPGVSALKELQEALQRQQELEAKIKQLQESLSVCYTKESRYSDRLSKASAAVTAYESKNAKLLEQVESLTCEVASLKQNVSKLTDDCSNKDNQINDLTESLTGYRERFNSIREKLSSATDSRTKLSESLSVKNNEVDALTRKYKALEESTSTQLQEAKKTSKKLQEENKALNEELQEVKRDSKISLSQTSAKLEKAEVLVEKYKSIAKTAVDRYIQVQAAKIGVPGSDIKARLTESYSFKDIDKVCEDLQQYKVNLNSLPFSTISNKKPVRAQIRESATSLTSKTDNKYSNMDDDIDDTLVTFIN